MTEIKVNLGNKIKFLRELRGISQEAVALEIGISQQAFQQIESGKTKINLNRADEIARSLGIDVESLLTFQPANILNNCTQSGVMSTYNFISDKLIVLLEGQNRAFKEQIEFLQQQNMHLLELLGKRE